ncbi:MAG: dihydrofolate reductase family protein [Ilumatobacteraceae bacterium]
MLRRILPEPAAHVTIRETYDVDRPRPVDRPWIGLCMVASLDGSTVVDGRSRALSNAHDTEVVLTLRDIADIIIVGAGTARAEGYGPPRKPGQRVGVVSNSGRIDPTSSLFASGAGFLILPESAPDPPVDSIRAGNSSVDLPLAVRMLGETDPAIGFVHAEGGPQLNAALASNDIIDELNLTLSPQIVGGVGPRLTAGELDVESDFDLAHLVVDEESFLFSRWVRRRAC